MNLKKRGEQRLDFAEAMNIAESSYNNHFKEWNKTQRNIASMDIFEAFEVALDDTISVPYKFLEDQINDFIQEYKQNKYFIRKHITKLNTEYPFAWSKEKQEFYIKEIQIA
ncbi:hypothetical protein F895_03023 [Acinetobacter sp. CIP 64.2]|nr:hypothetical protein F895_03023 [Acinetobacter sp. CIP 64.2]